MSDTLREMQASYQALFIDPYATHKWTSTSARSHWVDLEGWQDALAGPLSSIAHTGGCKYVHSRQDDWFAGVDTPAHLRLRLFKWHAQLAEGIEQFIPSTCGESTDHAFMRHVASEMLKLIECSCAVEQARYAAESNR